MYWISRGRKDGTGPENLPVPDLTRGLGQAMASGCLEDESCDKCPYCQGTRLCTVDAEICCTGCGAVVGKEYHLQEAPIVPKLNLFQATEVGAANVDLECARHIHENTEASQLSNVCVKLDMPMYAAKDVQVMFKKLTRKRLQDRDEYAAKRVELENLIELGMATSEDLRYLRMDRPKGCTKAHIVIFAVYLVCRKYRLPRTEEEIIEAVQMNFGSKRTSTMLKTCLRNDEMAQDLGIEYDCDSAEYYAKLLLRDLKKEMGASMAYDRIERYTFENLRYITDSRDDAKARRALNLAIKNTRLCIPI